MSRRLLAVHGCFSALLQSVQDHQEQAADNRQMFQARGEFPFFTIAVQQPEAMSDQGCHDRESGEHRRAKCGTNAGDNGEAAEELDRDGTSCKQLRPRYAKAGDLRDCGRPMSELVLAAVEENGGQKDAGQQWAVRQRDVAQR